MRLSVFERIERLTVDAWIERNVKVKDAPFRYRHRPFMRLPAQSMGDLTHNCRVVIECCAQVGKTENMLGFLGWACQQNPDNFLWVMDSAKSCTKVVKNRMRPFLRDVVKIPSLQRGVYVQDRSASAFNISIVTGKNLLIGSARSASDLCSFPAKYVVCDEVSRFPEELDEEGDPISLLLKRQLTYSHSMAVLASTPTTEAGAIHVNYLCGTQEVWSVKCHCGEYMEVAYKDIDWIDPDKPCYSCHKCGEIFDEGAIIALEHTFAPPKNKTPVTDEFGRLCRSFHIGATLCHDVYSWKKIRGEELEARAKGFSTYRSFVNTTLGEPYVPGYDEQINVDAISRCKRYFTKDSLPGWVKTVCIGADTQDNRIEWIALGFNKRGTHIAFIERGVVLGDLSESEVWEKWKKTLAEMAYERKDGQILFPAIVCQDAGGHFYHSVLTLGLENARIRPVRGYASAEKNETPIIRKQYTANASDIGRGNGKVVVTQINVIPAKDIIRRNLLLIQRDARSAPWVISGDPNAHFDAVFFDEMNSEIREVSSKGVVRWVKKPNTPNELLDCTVYGIAAYEIVKMAFGELADDAEWKEHDVDVNSESEKTMTVEDLLNEVRCENVKKIGDSQSSHSKKIRIKQMRRL